LVVPARGGIGRSNPGSDVVGPPSGDVSSSYVLELEKHALMLIININQQRPSQQHRQKYHKKNHFSKNIEVD